MKDIFAFFDFFFVVLLAFGMAFKGMMTQEHHTSVSTREALERVYWATFGDLGLSDYATEGTVVTFLFAVFLVVANLVLINLLIAILATTYADVQESAISGRFTHAIVTLKSVDESTVIPHPFMLVYRLIQGVALI